MTTTKAAKTKKPGPLTMDALEKWLKKQNPKTEYTYSDPGDCLMARFARAQGYGDVRASIDEVYADGETVASFPAVLDDIANYETSSQRTYGGALEALQAMKPKKTPKPKKET